MTAPSVLEVDLGEWLVDHGYAKAFGNKELVNFTRQLAVMVNAGVPILQSLEILFKQEKENMVRKDVRSSSKNSRMPLVLQSYWPADSVE